jgi:hypothetical protein
MIFIKAASFMMLCHAYSVWFYLHLVLYSELALCCLLLLIFILLLIMLSAVACYVLLSFLCNFLITFFMIPCMEVSEGRVCNSYATCILLTVAHGWVVPCEIVCKVHITQLLRTLSLLTAEYTNFSVVG